MRTQRVLALSLVAACKGENKDAPSESAGKPTELKIEPMAKPAPDEPAPTGTPRPQGKLAVTVDGTPVEMATALAWKAWDGVVRVTASSVPVGCEEVTGEMRSLHEGEVTFDVELAHALQPDGSLKPELRSTYFQGMTAQKNEPATATGDGTPGQPTTIEVDFETTDTRGKKLTVKGTIDALGCEVQPRKDAPALPPEQPAKITIAGKTFPVRFAKFTKTSDDIRSIWLFTGAEGCSDVAFSPRSEVTVDVTWFEPDKPEAVMVSLGGTKVGQAGGHLKLDKKKLLVKQVPAGAGELDLNGDFKVADFLVKLEGKVTVTECPK